MGRACIEAAARYWCSDWFQDLTAAAVRAAPWVRFHFVGKPFLSKASPFGTRVHGELAHDDSGIIKDRLANLRTKIDQAVWDLPSHFASIIRPPPHVLDATGCFTRDQYSRGAIRLTEDYNNPHPDTDYAHMNGQYGRDLVKYLLVDLHRAKETSGCAAVAAADAVTLTAPHSIELPHLFRDVFQLQLEPVGCQTRTARRRQGSVRCRT